nr:protein SIEVE ELEMENT OCCLUSION B-like isoform X2 [Ipomoea trifida]
MATQPLSLSRTMISKLQITDVDEKIIIEQVKDTHNPNGGIDVDANSLLKLLEGIFTLNTDSKSAEDNSEKEDETSNENPESDEDNSENEDEFSNEDSESDEDNPLYDEFEGDGVLLLISSGKHFPYYAYYAEARTGVQTIWVPITNDVDEDIQMPYSRGYYRVLDLQSGIAPAFLRFLQDKCFPTFQVGGDPIVISLDKRGRLVHSNALHMTFTWGNQRSERKTMRSGDIILSLENELRERTSGADRVIDDIDKQIHNFAREVNKKINDWVDDIKAKMKSSFRSYNFTREREQELWIKGSWNLNLVAGWSYNCSFELSLNYWIDDDKYIFLCGGNNIKRVLEFVLKPSSPTPTLLLFGATTDEGCRCFIFPATATGEVTALRMRMISATAVSISGVAIEDVDGDFGERWCRNEESWQR